MTDIFNPLLSKESDDFKTIIGKIKTAESYMDKLFVLNEELIVHRNNLWFKAITEQQLLANTDWSLISAIGALPTLKYSGDESLADKLLLG